MIKEEKLVSIIMSAYNSENTIIDSIESLLNQTYKNIEILIVDDCSVDKTYEICEHYEKKNKNIAIIKTNFPNFLFFRISSRYPDIKNKKPFIKAPAIGSSLKKLTILSPCGCGTPFK